MVEVDEKSLKIVLFHKKIPNFDFHFKKQL